MYTELQKALEAYQQYEKLSQEPLDENDIEAVAKRFSELYPLYQIIEDNYHYLRFHSEAVKKMQIKDPADSEFFSQSIDPTIKFKIKVNGSSIEEKLQALIEKIEVSYINVREELIGKNEKSYKSIISNRLLRKYNEMIRNENGHKIIWLEAIAKDLKGNNEGNLPIYLAESTLNHFATTFQEIANFQKIMQIAPYAVRSGVSTYINSLEKTLKSNITSKILGASTKLVKVMHDLPFNEFEAQLHTIQYYADKSLSNIGEDSPDYAVKTSIELQIKELNTKYIQSLAQGLMAKSREAFSQINLETVPEKGIPNEAIKYTNQLSSLVLSSVLKAESPESRVGKFKQWMHVANECLYQGDFQSTISILFALDNTAISRLKLIDSLNEDEKEIYEVLDKIKQSLFITKEDLLKYLSNNWDKPTIPYLATFSKYISGIQDNYKMLSKEERENTKLAELDSMKKVIADLQSYQDKLSLLPASNSSLNNAISNLLESVAHVDDEKSYEISLKLLPRGQEAVIPAPVNVVNIDQSHGKETQGKFKILREKYTNEQKAIAAEKEAQMRKNNSEQDKDIESQEKTEEQIISVNILSNNHASTQKNQTKDNPKNPIEELNLLNTSFLTDFLKMSNDYLPALEVKFGKDYPQIIENFKKLTIELTHRIQNIVVKNTEHEKLGDQDFPIMTAQYIAKLFKDDYKLIAQYMEAINQVKTLVDKREDLSFIAITGLKVEQKLSNDGSLLQKSVEENVTYFDMVTALPAQWILKYPLHLKVMSNSKNNVLQSNEATLLDSLVKEFEVIAYDFNVYKKELDGQRNIQLSFLENLTGGRSVSTTIPSNEINYYINRVKEYLNPFVENKPISRSQFNTAIVPAIQKSIKMMIRKIGGKLDGNQLNISEISDLNIMLKNIASLKYFIKEIDGNYESIKPQLEKLEAIQLELKAKQPIFAKKAIEIMIIKIEKKINKDNLTDKGITNLNKTINNINVLIDFVKQTNGDPASIRRPLEKLVVALNKLSAKQTKSEQIKQIEQMKNYIQSTDKALTVKADLNKFKNVQAQKLQTIYGAASKEPGEEKYKKYKFEKKILDSKHGVEVGTNKTVEFRQFGKDSYNRTRIEDISTRIEFYIDATIRKINDELEKNKAVLGSNDLKITELQDIKIKFLQIAKENKYLNIDPTELRQHAQLRNKAYFKEIDKEAKLLFSELQRTLIYFLNRGKGDLDYEAELKNFAEMLKHHVIESGRPNFVNDMTDIDQISAHFTRASLEGKTYPSSYRHDQTEGINPNAVYEIIGRKTQVDNQDDSPKITVPFVGSRATSWSVFDLHGDKNAIKRAQVNYANAKADISQIAKEIAAAQDIKEGQTLELDLHSTSLLTPWLGKKADMTLKKAMAMFGLGYESEYAQLEDHHRALNMLNGQIIEVDLNDGKRIHVKLNISHINIPVNIPEDKLKKIRISDPHAVVSSFQDDINARGLTQLMQKQDKTLENYFKDNDSLGIIKLLENIKNPEISDLEEKIKDTEDELAEKYTKLTELAVSTKDDETYDKQKLNDYLKAEKDAFSLEHKVAQQYNKLMEVRKKLWIENKENFNEAILKVRQQLTTETDPDKIQHLQQFLYYADMQEMYFTGDYKYRENVYPFTAIISRLTDMANGVPLWNCKSSKDRSGMHADWINVLIAGENRKDPENREGITNVPLRFAKQIIKDVPERGIKSIPENEGKKFAYEAGHLAYIHERGASLEAAGANSFGARGNQVDWDNTGIDKLTSKWAKVKPSKNFALKEYRQRFKEANAIATYIEFYNDTLGELKKLYSSDAKDSIETKKTRKLISQFEKAFEKKVGQYITKLAKKNPNDLIRNIADMGDGTPFFILNAVWQAMAKSANKLDLSKVEQENLINYILNHGDKVIREQLYNSNQKIINKICLGDGSAAAIDRGLNFLNKIRDLSIFGTEVSNNLNSQFRNQLNLFGFNDVKNTILKQAIFKELFTKISAGQAIALAGDKVAEIVKNINALFPENEIIRYEQFGEKYIEFLKISEDKDIPQLNGMEKSFISAVILHNVKLVQNFNSTLENAKATEQKIRNEFSRKHIDFTDSGLATQQNKELDEMRSKLYEQMRNVINYKNSISGDSFIGINIESLITQPELKNIYKDTLKEINTILDSTVKLLGEINEKRNKIAVNLQEKQIAIAAKSLSVSEQPAPNNLTIKHDSALTLPITPKIYVIDLIGTDELELKEAQAKDLDGMEEKPTIEVSEKSISYSGTQNIGNTELKAAYEEKQELIVKRMVDKAREIFKDKPLKFDGNSTLVEMAKNYYKDLLKVEQELNDARPKMPLEKVEEIYDRIKKSPNAA